MASDPHVVILSNKIKETIEVTLNQSSTPLERQIAYQVQEEFKAGSPYCSEVGFYLFSKNQNFNSNIRLCGLQLVDHFIKSKWNGISYERKVAFKEEAIKLLREASFNEPVYMKESIAKVVVEIIKRQWPQQWVGLFADLSSIQMQGNGSLEMVLIVLLRLSEDINGLDDHLTPQRRKDMLTTLNNNADHLFNFFINTIKDNGILLQQKYDKEVIRVSEATLFVIMEFGSWVKFEYLLAEEKILFQVLFWLLERKELRYHAANCLNILFERKGASDKRVEFMIILSHDALGMVEKVIRSLKKTDENVLQEDDHTFLKKLTDVLVNFGKNQIATLWGDEKGFDKKPECFDKYLMFMIDLMQHESIKISFPASKVFLVFLMHDHIKKDEFFLSIIPKVLESCLLKIQKLYNADTKNNVWQAYNLMDFDDADEFKEMFGTSQCHFLDLIRRCTEFTPFVALEFCLYKIKEAASTQPPDVSSLPREKLLLTIHYIYWDALAHVSKQFSNVFFKARKKISERTVTLCNEIISLLISYKCETPLFMFPVITMIEAMFPVFQFSQAKLLPTMQMIFSMINLPGSEQLFKLKRQICITFNNLCKEIPQILVTIFTDLEDFVNQQFQNDSLTPHEKSMLIEGLLRICKCLPDKTMQEKFISKTFHYVNAVLNRADVSEACNDPLKLLSFLGLDKVSNDKDAVQRRRKELLMALYLWLPSTKALIFTKEDETNDYPSDEDIKMQVQQYPWIQYMINILPKIFNLLKQYSLLWTCQDQIANKNVLLHSSIEHQGIMGNISSAALHNEGEQIGRGQYYLCTLHDTLYSSIGFCCSSIGPSLYSLNGLAEIIVDKLVNHWSHLPVYRLNKLMMKYYETTLGPFLAAAIKFMFNRVSNEWERVKIFDQVKKEKRVEKEDIDNESSEVREERSIYTLSKEFVDLMILFCTFKRKHLKENPKPQEGSINVLGKLGEFLLTYEGTNLTIICALFTAVTWPDSSVAMKLTSLIISIVRKVFVSENRVDSSIPTQLFMQLLKSLQIHGAEDMARSLITNTILQVYVHFRMQYPDITKIMLMVPSCTQEELQAFDVNVFANDTPLTENQRKKSFRTFVSGVCGKTFSGLYKEKIEIKDLPALAPRAKPNTSLLEETSEEAALCNLFNPGV